MTRGLLTDRAELEHLFGELAQELLAAGIEVEIVMVGGAWMLWHADRASTLDVDSARRFETDISQIVRRIGGRHDLGADWLNDSAAAFWPIGASFMDCHVVFEHEALVVRAPEPDVIFVMKLYRADPQDREDMIALWPLCSFTGPDAVVAAFTSAYPHAPHDEHLASYVADVARDAANQ